jgi:hypothetical protein
MSEEQLCILKMLAEGKISAEQAEGLLEALDKGEEPQPGPAQEALDKLGKVIGGVMHDHAGMPWGPGGSAEEEGEEVGPEGIELPEDADVVLRVKGGKVRVRAAEGTRTAEFTSSGSAPPRVRMDDGKCLISVGPRSGEVEIALPEVRAVSVRLTGGRVEMDGVGGSIRANVKGGDMQATACRGSLEAKCMGGSLSVAGRMSNADVTCMGGSVKMDGLLIDSGRHAVKMMGGDAVLSFLPGSSVRIQTSIMGGDVRTDLPKANESGGPIRRRAEYVIGGGEALLTIKLMGGDVTIAEAQAAEPDAAEAVKESA